MVTSVKILPYFPWLSCGMKWPQLPLRLPANLVRHQRIEMQIVGDEHNSTPESCLMAIVGDCESHAYLLLNSNNTMPTTPICGIQSPLRDDDGNSSGQSGTNPWWIGFFAGLTHTEVGIVALRRFATRTASQRLWRGVKFRETDVPTLHGSGLSQRDNRYLAPSTKSLPQYALALGFFASKSFTDQFTSAAASPILRPPLPEIPRSCRLASALATP